MPTTNYKYTTFNQTNGKHIPALSVEDVFSIQGKDIVWTFQLQPMQHRLQERPTQHLSVKQIKIWLVRGCIYIKKTGAPPLVNPSASAKSLLNQIATVSCLSALHHPKSIAQLTCLVSSTSLRPLAIVYHPLS